MEEIPRLGCPGWGFWGLNLPLRSLPWVCQGPTVVLWGTQREGRQSAIWVSPASFSIHLSHAFLIECIHSFHRYLLSSYYTQRNLFISQA